MDFYRPPNTQGVIEAIGAIYRALRAFKAYPEGHQNQLSSIMSAHTSMLALLNGNNLSLSCGKTSFSFPDGETIKDNTVLSKSLLPELIERSIEKITFLKDLYQEDLLKFLRILSLSPDAIRRSGGFDKMMAEQGVRSIWVNEFDLAVINRKRREVEFGGVKTEGSDGVNVPTAPAFSSEQQPLKSDDLPPEQMLPMLLARMRTTQEDDVYVKLIRQAVSCGDILKSRQEYLELFPMLELLASHFEDAARTENIRKFARSAMERVSNGNQFINFVLGRITHTDSLSKGCLQAIISIGGSSAILLVVEHLGATNNIAERKALSNLLARLGEQAVPILLNMLADGRWFVVRNISAVLGEIASPEAVPGLIRCLRHSDSRVCKEAIRSLAKIGGREAELALIGLLHQDDESLYPQVINSLGAMKSKASLVDLMNILFAKDTFLQKLALKIDALAAITMIGDRQVVPYLLKLLAASQLLAAGSWKQLKVAVAKSLGRFQDPQALPVLKELSSTSGELGAACSEAIKMIEKSGRGSA